MRGRSDRKVHKRGKWKCDEPIREPSQRTVPSSIKHVVMLFEALGGAGTGEMEKIYRGRQIAHVVLSTSSFIFHPPPPEHMVTFEKT